MSYFIIFIIPASSESHQNKTFIISYLAISMGSYCLVDLLLWLDQGDTPPSARYSLTSLPRWGERRRRYRYHQQILCSQWREAILSPSGAPATASSFSLFSPAMTRRAPDWRGVSPRTWPTRSTCSRGGKQVKFMDLWVFYRISFMFICNYFRRRRTFCGNLQRKKWP